MGTHILGGVSLSMYFPCSCNMFGEWAREGEEAGAINPPSQVDKTIHLH